MVCPWTRPLIHIASEPVLNEYQPSCRMAWDGKSELLCRPVDPEGISIGPWNHFQKITNICACVFVDYLLYLSCIAWIKSVTHTFLKKIQVGKGWAPLAYVIRLDSDSGNIGHTTDLSHWTYHSTLEYHGCGNMKNSCRVAKCTCISHFCFLY